MRHETSAAAVTFYLQFCEFSWFLRRINATGIFTSHSQLQRNFTLDAAVYSSNYWKDTILGIHNMCGYLDEGIFWKARSITIAVLKRINLKSMSTLQMLGLSLCHFEEIPYSSDSKESACNAGDQGSVPGLGRSSGEGKGNPLQILPREFHGQTMGPQRVRRA